MHPCIKQAVINAERGGGRFGPQRTLANVWRHFGGCCWRRGLLGVQWEEAGEAARPPTQHRMALTTKTSCPTVSEVLMFLKDKGCP